MRYEDEVLKFKLPNIMKVMPKYESILDVGSNTGFVLSNFKGKRVGIDTALHLVDVAKTVYPDIDFRNCKIEDVNEKFDVVLLSDILEHVEDDVGMLKKAGELGKFVIVNIPLEKSIRTMFRKYGKNDIAGHLRAYSLNDAKQLIKKAGLKIDDGFTETHISTFKRSFFPFLFGTNYFARLSKDDKNETMDK